MISYAERSRLGLFRWAVDHAQRIVAYAPDFDARGEEIRCHELARAVWHHLMLHKPASQGARVVDGHYTIGGEHSWILLTGEGMQAILDPYHPRAIPQVCLVEVLRFLPERTSLYRERETRTDIDERTVDAILSAARSKRWTS